jgi:hypothetical protein
VPAWLYQRSNWRQVAAIRIGHRHAEIVAGDGLLVVALEVQVHALAETVAAQQGLIHPHDLGALFVDGDGIKIIDLDKGVGTDRVGHRSGVFRELGLAQGAHLVDAGDGAAGVRADHVGREFLVAEHGQAFLQRQLEPVAAGDAVARPVVEVFVAHHGLDALEVDVRGDARIGQHELGVEDVQALVFHRPHVEVADGDDHEAVQVELEVPAFLVPADAVLERLHRVIRLVEVALFHPDLQQGRAAVGQLDVFFLAHEARGDEGEQVGRLLERVFPQRVVAAVGKLALLDQVTVRQQHRILVLVGAQHDGEAGHHVRTVRENR